MQYFLQMTISVILLHTICYNFPCIQHNCICCYLSAAHALFALALFHHTCIIIIVYEINLHLVYASYSWRNKNYAIIIVCFYY